MSYIHESLAVRQRWGLYKEKQEEELAQGLCLVSGESGPLAPLFPQVTGLQGAQSSGASLVSCNADAFSSYGQKTSTAGFISASSGDKAGAALSYVLKDNGHHVRMGNDHIAFWTDAANPKIDEDLAFLMDPDSLTWSEDKSVREAVQQALVEMRAGKRPDDIPEDTTYHLLGIAPYQARLAVRFYETGAMGKLRENVTQYLRDTEMEGVKPCSMRTLLLQTAAQADPKRLPTTLVTSCMRAYVRGTAFPPALMQKVIGRMRVDHGSYKSWDMGRRAALLKACLIRFARARGVELGKEMERRLTVGLNYENDNQGYLLGRLFALLEKAQQDAVRGANATIRDRFMGAAATTPARVFPQLLKLAQHHISKSDYGSLMDRRIQEVMGQMGDAGFPKTLSFDDQGMFYIGYYQQKQALYTKTQESAEEGKED
jgi:CRISPR-associated protein Csd1